jgi:uncharacterized protein YndB with AHSA1/START domain
MADILHETTIQATPEKVFQALTEQKGLASWSTVNTAAKPEVGSTAEFTFSQPTPFLIKMKIDKLEAGRKVYWTVEQGAPDWGGTRVTWDLTPVEGGTKILFGHRNFATTEGSFAGVSYNWAWFITSLKAYLETDKGTPVS